MISFPTGRRAKRPAKRGSVSERVFQIKYVNSKLTNDSLATVNYNTHIFNLMYESAEISVSETFISSKSNRGILGIYSVLMK